MGVRGAAIDAGDTDAEVDAPGVGGDEVDMSTSGRHGDSAAGAGAYIPLPRLARSLPSWCVALNDEHRVRRGLGEVLLDARRQVLEDILVDVGALLD